MSKFLLAFLLMFVVLLSSCQNQNIRGRISGDQPRAGEKQQKADERPKETISLSFPENEKKDIEVKEGIIIGEAPIQRETQRDLTITINRNDDVADLGRESERGQLQTQTAQTATSLRRVPGFRVQLLSVSNRDAAERVSNDFQSRWENARRGPQSHNYRDTIPAYIEFYDPFWKLRVGNFRTRTEAEENLRLVRSLGFSDAWIVSTTVLVRD